MEYCRENYFKSSKNVLHSMSVKFSVKIGKIEEETGVHVIPVYEDLISDPPIKLSEKIKKILEQVCGREFKGRIEETYVLPTFLEKGPSRIVLTGLGKSSELELDSVRRAYGRAALKMEEMKFSSTYIPIPSLPYDIDLTIQTIVEGILLSLYRFDRYKSEKEKQALEEVYFLVEDESKTGDIQRSIDLAEKICRGVYTARDIANMPSNDCYPEKLAEMAIEVGSRAGFKVRIYKMDELMEMEMGGIIAVGGGSNHKPVLIEMEYDGTCGGDKPYVIVGKAVTFDSGGISIKPSEKMEEMKYDKSGGAAVIGIMEAAALLKLPLRLIGLVPCVENMPSGTAYRPGDIVRFRNGKTAEIISTDAEGRLILADALAYAVEKNPKVVIDLATLTGACIIALGTHASGLFTNNQQLADKIMKSSEKTGEKTWQLPLWKQYKEQIKSDVADLKNVGGRPAGAITAAAFLSEFVRDAPWIHLDIAGTAYTQETSEQKSYIPKGATGVGVRLIIDYLINELKQE